MCEILAVAWAEPRPLSLLLPYALEMERLGVAGFGWGVAWLGEETVEGYRTTRALTDDHGERGRLGSIVSDRFLLHLRRPSRLSTIQLADAQPFLTADGRFAFCHNGAFLRHERFRQRFEGRLEGRADSEIAFRLLEERLSGGASVAEELAQVAGDLGGSANLGYLGEDGRLLIRYGHPGNHVWRFRMDGGDLAATELHSRDESLFGLVFPEARDRVPLEGTTRLGRQRPDATRERSEELPGRGDRAPTRSRSA